jgi:AraC-like DNA-binding protein
MEYEPTLSPRFVAYVRDYLMDRSVDPEPVFQELGIPIRQTDEFDAPLPVPKVAALLQRAAVVSDNPCMGLHMAQNYHYEGSSLLILAMLAAPSVEEGIRCLCRYDRFIDTGIEARFDFDRPQAEFTARLLAADDVTVDQLNEYLLSFLVQALNTATRKPVPVTEVEFRHPAPHNRSALERHFRAPVAFGCDSNRLYFDRSFLQERFLSSHAMLYDILVNALKTYFCPSNQSSVFVDMVCREIIRCGNEEAGTERIAGRLAMSSRTLRRRLADEGCSFQEVKDLARENRAKYYLSRTNMPLSEIAFELGYSELSAFSRAFRRWVGQTPQSYRDKVRQMIGA